MPNRYANLTPSAKISQEYTKITEGFDKVQQEMDQRIAKDNDLQSQLTNERQQRIAADNAHQNSTAAHPAEHITYSGKVSGASNVKQAADRLSDRIDNIVAQGGSDNTEVVDARMGADGVARPTLGTLVREIHAQQLDEARQTVKLGHGLNVVETDQASPAEMKIFGRTMVNLLGNVGGCESLEPFTKNRSNADITVTSEIKRSGNGALHFNTDGPTAYLTKNLEFALDNSKHYLFCGWLYWIRQGPGSPALILRKGQDITYEAGREWRLGWQFQYVKLPAGHGLTSDLELMFGLVGGGGANDNEAVYDEIALYEITAEEYAKIDVDPDWTGEKLAERFPYVDGIQHVTNPVITKLGKNLFRFVNAPGIRINEMNGATYADSNYRGYSDYMEVVPGQVYTLSVGGVKATTSTPYAYYNENKQYVSGGLLTGTSSVVPSTARYIRVSVRNDWNPDEIQFELGTNATPYTPRNDDHIYAECTLRSLPNGVRDVLDITTKTKTKNIGQVMLDGSENWSGFVKTETYCNVGISNWQSAHNAIRFFHNENADAALAWNDDLGMITIASSPTFGIPSVGVTSGGSLTLTLPPTFDNLGEVKTYLAEHPITLVYQLANPITETVPVEGAIALHDGQNVIDVGEGAIREKVYFDTTTKRATLLQRSARILSVYKNANPVAFTTYTSNNSVQPQLIEDVDPDAEYTVWYQALDKYALTTSVNDVAVTYKTNQKTVVDGLVQDMADAKTEISIHDRILAEYAARLLALEEGM